MIDATSECNKLTELATELDTLSKKLGSLLAQLEPVQAEYDHWMAGVETRLWKRHLDTGEKLPSEKLRTQIAVLEMPRELSERHAQLSAESRRTKERISALKQLVDAHRSILSALKLEMEATR